MPRPDREPRRVRPLIDPLREFLHAEVAGGVVLAVAALTALVWANSPLNEVYNDLWGYELTLGIPPVAVTEDLRHWVNDGLMAIFFFVIGLEIKRELVTGELRNPRAAMLPVLAACGGVALPAVIFLSITTDGPAAHGWGIPIATDIAFALGVLALLGDRVPVGAKLFLLTIAIVDDIIAITVIAIAYSDSISPAWLGGAAAGLIGVLGLRVVGVNRIWPYVLVALAVWFATLESGVHATVAGVALGLLTPAQPVGGRDVLRLLEHRLHPVSAFLVIPLFALANAGVALDAGALSATGAARPAAAVAIGLVIGKVFGVAGVTLLALRLRVGVLPEGVTTRYVWGLAALAGIGFTVSLFIADVAYDDEGLTASAKIGILGGSLVAGGVGSVILFAGRYSRTPRPPDMVGDQAERAS